MKDYETLIRPGQGVEVDRLPIAPIKNAMRAGTYEVDEGLRFEAQDMLANIKSTPNEEVKAVLHHPDRKGFRNSYASLIIEQAWQPYSGMMADTENAYKISFDEEGRSFLHPIDARMFATMPASSIAEVIASSNQGVLTHFICSRFADGKIPAISGDAEKDREYFDALKEQADLDIYAGSNFRTIPAEAGSPSVFVTSGSLVLRTHIFGLPNLIDEVTQRDGIHLTSDQHRNSFWATMRGSITHYYLPTTTITLAVNSQLIDPETLALKPEAWTHNGDSDNLVVYPLPEIVQGVNDSLAGVKDLPIQTGCPAFHGRVLTTESPGVIVPLPRSLPEMAMNQLDRWYYPRRDAA